jgi:hypothetical protein
VRAADAQRWALELSRMARWQYRFRLLLAAGSLVVPFAIVAAAATYQAYAHAGFWNSLGSDDSGAGAMMAFAEAAQLLAFAFVGCLSGFVLAIIGLLWPASRAVRIIGYVALVINGIGTVLLGAQFLKKEW